MKTGIQSIVRHFRRDDIWTPAFAGVTTQKPFYEAINLISQRVMEVFDNLLSHGKGQIGDRLKKRKGIEREGEKQ